jgi:hypothetical protein
MYNVPMDIKLRQYDEYVNNKINDLNNKKTHERSLLAKELLKHHCEMIRNFQHERLVHLLVTFFFSGLLILGIIVLFVPKGSEFAAVDILLLTNIIIIFTIMIFYIRHYYFLENGTQKLYGYSQIIYDMIKE